MVIEPKDVTALGLTFLMGFIVGVYLYLVGFLPIVSQVFSVIPEQTDEVGLVIVGEEYRAGTDAVVTAFRLEETGEYRYTPPLSATTTGVITGRIPADLRREIIRAADARPFADVAEVIDVETCLASEETAIRYQIRQGDERYVIDECGTQFDAAGELEAALAKLWNYIAVR